MEGTTPTVQEIIADWLLEHGYDGLYDDECGCRVGDLAPCCNSSVLNCRPGYLQECADEEFDFFVGPGRRAETQDDESLNVTP